jgi:hypothetical protein
MTCCDLWGSTGDDYGGTAEKGSELRDNVFVDPAFAGPDEMDYTPQEGSPVLSLKRCGAIGTGHARVTAFGLEREEDGPDGNGHDHSGHMH